MASELTLREIEGLERQESLSHLSRGYEAEWRDALYHDGPALLAMAKAQADGWVPVGERLPPDEEPVLGWQPEWSRPGTCLYDHQGRVWGDVETKRPVSITHWKPFGSLPSPPEEPK